MVNFTFVVDEFLVESPRLSNDDAISAMLEEMRQANAIRKTELQEAVKEANLQATRVVIKRPEKKALRKAKSEAEARRQAEAIRKAARFSSLAELRADFSRLSRPRCIRRGTREESWLHTRHLAAKL